MKISTGGIGTVVSGQSVSAMFPYQWSWNAVGTDLSSTTSSDVIEKDSVSSTVESHERGIKQTAKSASPLPSIIYRDELPTGAPGGNLSGKLTRADAAAAPYVHCVVDFSGWTSTNNILTGDNFTRAARGWNNGVMYWYTRGGETHLYRGGVALIAQANGTHILVWNLRDQLQGSGDDTESIWGTSSMVDEDPNGFQFYPGGTFASGTAIAAGNNLVLCGWVIADRILTDIPLPIRTHMG